MLMDNSGVTGGIISSGNEQQVDAKAPTVNGFEQLRPEDVAGSFDAYVNSGAVLAPNIETPKVELGQALEMMPQFPNSAEQLPSMGEQLANTGEQLANSGEQNLDEEGRPKGYRSEAEEDARKKRLAEEAKRKEEYAALPPDFGAMEGMQIARDADKIPAAYMNHYANGIDNCLKTNDPSKLVAFCDNSRWDYMKKVFNRNLGDGLNGKVA